MPVRPPRANPALRAPFTWAAFAARARPISCSRNSQHWPIPRLCGQRVSPLIGAGAGR